MELMINGHRIDFEAGNEKTVKELSASMRDWSMARGLVLSSVNADGRELSFESEEPLAGFTTIDYTILSRADLILDTLEEADAYCTRVSDYIAQGSAGAVAPATIAEGLTWLGDILRKVFSLLELSADEFVYQGESAGARISRLDGIAEAVAEKDASLADYSRLFQDLRGIIRLIATGPAMRDIIVKSIDSPSSLLQSLESARSAAPAMVASLEDISALFQSGADAKASEKLQSFIEFLHGYTRLCHQVGPVFSVDLAAVEADGVSLAEVNAGLELLLREIVTVMENDDIISLSDIIEYEVRPQMEKAIPLLDRLAGMIAS